MFLYVIVEIKIFNQIPFKMYLLFFRIVTCEDIGSARVKKRHPIKNTAMLLITKTINENKLMDKRYKSETKFDKNK